MEFRIADTFTNSLGKLTEQEQKAVKMTAIDLQLNPVSRGMRFHKLDRSKDPNFWSISVNMDIRLIIHRTDTSFLLCHVAHHDTAYDWAERRKIERHPKTGAAQLVEVRERVEEVVISQIIEQTKLPKRLLFAQMSDDDLLNYSVPTEWLEDVRQANEDSLLNIIDCLPQEAAEALLQLATGSKPQMSTVLPVGTDPFNHPDAQRRFQAMTNLEELECALESPWEKEAVFLHSTQHSLIEQNYTDLAQHKAIRVCQFTHTYRVTGEGRFDTAYLTLVEEDTLLDANEDFAYVSLLTVPKLEVGIIPSEVLPREGGQLNMLLELWSIASSTYKKPFYRKEEWSMLDALLFQYNRRTEEDKQKLSNIFVRQWAYAQQQKETYRPVTWQALYRLIQNRRFNS